MAQTPHNPAVNSVESRSWNAGNPPSSQSTLERLRREYSPLLQNGVRFNSTDVFVGGAQWTTRKAGLEQSPRLHYYSPLTAGISFPVCVYFRRCRRPVVILIRYASANCYWMCIVRATAQSRQSMSQHHLIQRVFVSHRFDRQMWSSHDLHLDCADP